MISLTIRNPNTMAETLNFNRIDQGANFIKEFRLLNHDTQEPIDLTGYSARMQIRYRTPSGDLVGTLDSTAQDPYITFDRVNGVMRFNVPAAVTTIWKAGDVVYDCELIYPNGRVDRIFEGSTSIIAEVTR